MGAATVTGGAVVLPQVIEQARTPVLQTHVHGTPPRVPKVRAAPVTAPAVVLTAQQTRAPQRTIAHDASSDEPRVTHDTTEVERHDGGGADGSEGAVSAPLKEPVQQETGDSREEAGVTVQAELDPTTTTTGRSDGGGEGIDGFGSGD